MKDIYMGSEIGVSLPIIDSADTDKNVWSAEKTKNEIGIVDDKVKDLQLYKFPNAIIYGQPTINNGQISGFSSANYLGLPFVFDTKDRGFEINVAFTTNSDVTTAQNIFGSKFCIALYIQNGQLVFRAGNGSEWTVADITTTLSVQANTTYYVKIAFNKLNYTISYSTNGEDYESIGSKVTTIPPTVGQVNIGIGNNQHNPFNGIVNLNKTFIKLNNTVVWEGMDDVGLATRLATDLENIDEAGIERVKEIAGNNLNMKVVNSVDNCIPLNELSTEAFICKINEDAEYHVIASRKDDLISQYIFSLNRNNDGNTLAFRQGHILSENIVFGDWEQVVTVSRLFSDLYYKAGDRINLNQIMCAGCISSSVTTVLFTIPLPKPMSARSAKISDTEFSCRYFDGYVYIDDGGNLIQMYKMTQATLENYCDINYYYGEGSVTVYCKLKTGKFVDSTGTDITNNIPVTFHITSGKLLFS